MTSTKIILATTACIAILSACTREYPTVEIPASVEKGLKATAYSEAVHKNVGDVEVSAVSDKHFHKFLRENREALYFDSGKHILSKEHKSVLDDVVSAAGEYVKYQILLVAHSDTVGPEDKNMILAEDRILSVSDYLEKKSVNPSNIVSRVLGEDHPAVVGDSDYRHKRNRRVEVYLILDRSEYEPGFKITLP